MDSKRLWSRLLIAVLYLTTYGLSQDQARAEVTATDEAELRTFAEQFYAAYSKKDLDGFMKLWSAKATGLDARRKATEEIFAGVDKIELKNLSVRVALLERDRARVLVTVEMNATNAKTGIAA